ncbi:MAG TPA: hypothetical protein VGT78_04440 [Rhizomicrobium sp.]|nr:hypothetical protein [Rhizomicrobium sp.]
MNGNGPFAITGHAGNYPLRKLAFRAGKAKPAKSFDDERQPDHSAVQGRREQKSITPPSQNETEHAPSWNASRLNPAFVAQILGQMLNDNERGSVRAAYAYGGEPARRALICDTQI